MSYVFPKRALKDSDILDPQDFNDDMVPAAELYSGHLDGHNFKDGLSPAVTENAYLRINYAKQDMEPQIGTPLNYQNLDVGATITDEFFIPSGGEWAVIDDAVVTVSTPTSVLWCIAEIQYLWPTWNDGDAASLGGLHDWAKLASGREYPVRLQFALRVNGRIIEGTITGDLDPYVAAVRGEKPVVWRDSGDRPGPRLEYEVDCGALGPELLPVRLGANVPVPAGTQTVEVVVRRLNHSTAGSGYAPGDKVWVLHRQLMVGDAPSLPPGAATFDSVTVPQIEPETVVNAEELGSTRLDLIRGKLNQIQPGALQRGALNHHHLPSLVGPGTQMLTIGGTTDSVNSTYYPGYATATLAGSPSATTGWYKVQEDATPANDLVTGTITIADPCWLVIMANVQVRNLTRYTAVGNTYPTIPLRSNWIGSLCLIYKSSSGSATVIPHSEVYFNGFNLIGGGIPSASRENWDIPIFAVLEFDSGALTVEDLDYIGVYASTIGPWYADSNVDTSGTEPSKVIGSTGPGNGRIDMTYRRGSLTILHILKASAT